MPKFVAFVAAHICRFLLVWGPDALGCRGIIHGIGGGAPGVFVCILGKHESFVVILFLFLIVLATGWTRRFLLLLAGWCPTVEKQEAGVDSLGIAVIPISILIFEVCSKIIESLAMGTADHQCCKVFLADGTDSKCTFGVGGRGSVYD